MFKVFALFILSLIFFDPLNGQVLLSVSGDISDENGEALLGANVYMPELELGAVSGLDGTFVIPRVPPGKFIIHISYVGYETDIRTIFLTDSSLSLNVSLVPSLISGKEVVISGGRHASQHKNSVKIELLNAQKIHQSGVTGVVENLSILPGVDLIGNGGGVVTPVIRGLATSNILMLNNGIRLENYQFSSDHPYLVDESGISQVEIIKGPASMLYGSDAIGGIINLIDDYSVEPNSVAGEANLKYLGNAQGYSGSLGLHGNQGILSWSLHGGSRNAKDFTDGEDRQVVNSRYNSHTFKSVLGLRFKQSLHRLRYEYQKSRPSMVNPASSGLVEDNDRSQAYWYQDLDMHLASFTNSWYLNRFKFHANSSFQKNFRKLITDEPGHRTVDMALTTFTFETRGNLVSSEVSEFTLALQGLNQQNRNLDGEMRVLPDYSYNDIGIFGLVQHDFLTKIHLQVGLRFDNRFLQVPTQEKAGHSHEEHEEEEEEKEEELLDGFQNYYGNVSASLGATVELGEGILLRGNLASAYRAPTVAELTQDGEHGIRYEQGNPDLSSQRSYEVDLSFHYHREIILIDLAAFYNHINNYIYLAYTTDTTDEGQHIYRYTQNDARLFGFEAMTEVLPVKGLRLKLAYNYTRGQLTSWDNLPFIPHNKLLSDVHYTLPGILKKGNLYLKIGGDYAFAQNHPSENESTSPSWFLLHAGAGLNIPSNDHMLSLSLQVRNLLNTAYIDHLSVLKEMDYLNMGRNVVLTLSVPFSLYGAKK